MGAEASAFEALLARDRVWVVLGLGVAVVLCWAWLVLAALDMQGDMRGLAAWMMSSRWDLRYFLLILGMWAVMMTGMMLPSAAPALLLYGHIVRSDAQAQAPLRRIYAFATGYLLAWCGFSLLATTLQWALAQAALLSPMMRVHNAMFAAAMAFSLGIKLDAIRQGLRTFDTTFYQAPGRMNVFDEHPFKVIFDYAHNAHAVGVMADLAERLDVQGRRIVVVAGPGDRRDEDIVAIAETVAGRFDHYICRRDDSLRGRDGDEVPGMIAKVLRACGVPESAISIIPDEQEAIDAALKMGEQGDLLLIFADSLARSWKQVTKFRSAGTNAVPSPVGEKVTPVTGKRGAGNREVTQEEQDELNRVGDAAVEAAGFIRDERGLRFVKESED